jgi:hypothetical protein
MARLLLTVALLIVPLAQDALGAHERSSFTSHGHGDAGHSVEVQLDDHGDHGHEPGENEDLEGHDDHGPGDYEELGELVDPAAHGYDGHASHDDHASHGDNGHAAHAGEHSDGGGAAVNVLVVAGDSSVDDELLETLQGGGHDPRRSGATLQQVELGLHGDLGGGVHATAYLVQGEEELEVEEAYLEVTSHDSVRARAGYFLSPFGVAGQRHAHRWQWIDQPFIATRLLGGDGTRGAGGRFDFALGHDWDSRLTLSAQQADDDTMVSFRGRGHVHGAADHGHGEGGEEESLVEHLEETFGGLTAGNRPYIEDGGVLYGARLSHAWDDGCATRWQLGGSALYGPNASGADSGTLLYGADLSLRWQPCPGQWPFVLWESECMSRSFDAAAVFNDDEPDEVIDLPAATLRDSGWYSQLLYGFTPRWAAGLRYESAGGSGESVGGTGADPLRADRTRISPLLAWYGTENNLRVRLQYNFDAADHLATAGRGRDAQSIWLGVDFSLGSHHHGDDPGLAVAVHPEEGGAEGDSHAGHGH